MQELPAGFRVVPQQTSPEVIPLPRTPQQQEETERKRREESYQRGDRTTDVASSLRKEFQATDFAKNYNVALGTYYSALQTKPTPEGDQSLIVSFARMLDPNSVVREGEFVVAASNEAAFTRFLNTVKREFGVDEAGRLSPQGRDRLREEMRNLVVNRFKRPYDQTRQMYEGYARASGVEPELVVGQPPELAFPSGILESPIAQAEQTAVATGDTQIQNQLPAEYQQRHLDYMRQNWGKVDPRDYAQFRSALDEEYGFTPNPIAYREAVPSFNDLAKQGGTPQQLGAVPSPEVPLEGLDAMLNTAAQSPEGAGFIGFANAASAGIPIALAGGQENLQTIRDINPVASAAGEIAGGITGSLATGGALSAAAKALQAGRAAQIASNPVVSDALYGATYGLSEGGATGGLAGAGASLLGSGIGRAVGRAFPDTFAPGAMNEARESVPTIPQLQERAAQQYAAAEGAGEIADPASTIALAENARRILQRESRLTPENRMIDVDTPTTRAMMLLSDFSGREMTPGQAGSVRKVLAEGLMNPEAEQRRLSGMLVDEFDEWAQPVLPGIAGARETASRYLQGQEIQRAIDLAGADKSRLTQSGYENALRGQFRNMERATIRGKTRHTGAVNEAIERVSQGDRIANAARALGKYAPTSTVAMATGGGAAGMLGNMIGGPTVGIPAAIATMGAGTAARMLATKRAETAAQDALLTALGGPQFEAMRQQAIEEAAIRAGRIGGGLFGSSGVMANRQRLGQ